MNETLSSGATPIFKFFLPPFVLLAFAALFISVLDEGVGSVFICLALICFFAFIVWQFLVPLKRVVATHHGLVINNYRTSITVPYTEIMQVTRALKRLDVIEVAFRSDTPFGRTIIFMAGARLFWWPEHPVVSFLRRRAGLDPAT